MRTFLATTLATLAATVATAGGATAASPHWQALPVKYPAASVFFFRTLGWASGQVWLVLGCPEE